MFFATSEPYQLSRNKLSALLWSHTVVFDNRESWVVAWLAWVWCASPRTVVAAAQDTATCQSSVTHSTVLGAGELLALRCHLAAHGRAQLGQVEVRTHATLTHYFNDSDARTFTRPRHAPTPGSRSSAHGRRLQGTRRGCTAQHTFQAHRASNLTRKAATRRSASARLWAGVTNWKEKVHTPAVVTHMQIRLTSG